MILRIGALFAAALLAACGGGNSGCDSANISATCNIAALGECSEFTALTTIDATDVKLFCTTNNGVWDQTTSACATSGRLGSCKIPAEGQGTHITCSANATVTIRYFPPYTQTQAQGLCAGVTGGVWTPN